MRNQMASETSPELHPRPITPECTTLSQQIAQLETIMHDIEKKYATSNESISPEDSETLDRLKKELTTIKNPYLQAPIRANHTCISNTHQGDIVGYPTLEYLDDSESEEDSEVPQIHSSSRPYPIGMDRSVIPAKHLSGMDPQQARQLLDATIQEAARSNPQDDDTDDEVAQINHFRISTPVGNNDSSSTLPTSGPSLSFFSSRIGSSSPSDQENDGNGGCKKMKIEEKKDHSIFTDGASPNP